MGSMGLKCPLDTYSIQFPENADDIRMSSADKMRFEINRCELFEFENLTTDNFIK